MKLLSAERPMLLVGRPQTSGAGSAVDDDGGSGDEAVEVVFKMANIKTYSGSCHCGAVRFSFRSEEITTGCRCNCSFCTRKGTVMSSKYIAPDDFDLLEGKDALSVYQFGDRDVNHYFCKTCGICPFNGVASVPATYEGSAKPGYRRVNLGCIEGLDPLALQIDIINGRSF